jgi:hypothetical protein
MQRNKRLLISGKQRRKRTGSRAPCGCGCRFGCGVMKFTIGNDLTDFYVPTGFVLLGCFSNHKNNRLNMPWDNGVDDLNP